MNKKIKVSMPLNVAHDEIDLFKPYLSYDYPVLKVKYIKSAFITSTGLVCKSNGALVKECCHYNWDQQPAVCQSEALWPYKDALENPENLLVFDDDETYLVVHNRWQHNYYHWLNEAMYRLWMVKDKATEMILLLPSKDTMSKFALDSLQFFSLKNIIHIPTEKSALVRTLCMPVQKPYMENYNPDVLLGLNKLYVNNIGAKINQVFNVNERVFVSRKNTSRRRILNENEVIERLNKYNFTIIYCEDYTFFEQVSLFSKVKYLISIHGAGLTNMLFMPPGSTVLEFHKRKTNPIRHQNLLFWYMADALGHKYYHQICEPIDINELFFKADIVVDINLLNKNLELIFSN